MMRQFPLKEGGHVPWSCAEEAFATYKRCVASQVTLDEIAAAGGFPSAEYALYLKGINPKTMKRADGGIPIKALVLIADGTPDSVGDVILPNSVYYSEKVSITRNFRKDSESRLGIGKISRVGSHFFCEFIYPSLTLPEFPLYPAMGGQLLDAEDKDGKKFIKKLKLEEVALCATKNVDERIPAIKPK